MTVCDILTNIKQQPCWKYFYCTSSRNDTVTVKKKKKIPTLSQIKLKSETFFLGLTTNYH